MRHRLAEVEKRRGDKASREPWRNLYAHLMAEMGWAEFEMNFAGLELYAYLAAKPRALLDGMLAKGINAPMASSCYSRRWTRPRTPAHPDRLLELSEWWGLGGSVTRLVDTLT